MANFDLAVYLAIDPAHFNFFLHFWSGKVSFGHGKNRMITWMAGWKGSSRMKSSYLAYYMKCRKKGICQDSGKDPICHIVLSD